MEPENFKQDLLGGEWKNFATRLNEFIEIERTLVPGGLVVGLNGKFGEGKSTFLRMWKNELSQSDSVHVVRLNAWEYDFVGDALFAILHCLLDSLQGSSPQSARLRNALADFGWFTLGLGDGLAKSIGVHAISAYEFAGRQKDQRQKKRSPGGDAFDALQKRHDAMDKLKIAISGFASHQHKQGTPVLFLVDELDRCRPNFAIEYLETIKHFFDTKWATFVLAVDRAALRNSAITAFGDDLDFDEYYRKFVHKEVSLPTPTNISGLISSFRERFLEVSGLRSVASALTDRNIVGVRALCLHFRMTPRQIEDLFRNIAHVFTQGGESASNNLLFGTLISLVFRSFDRSIYEHIRNGTLTHDLVMPYIGDLEGGGFWYSILDTGGAMSRIGDHPELRLKPAAERHQQRDFMKRGWPRSQSRNHFASIVRRIESLEDWLTD